MALWIVCGMHTQRQDNLAMNDQSIGAISEINDLIKVHIGPLN